MTQNKDVLHCRLYKCIRMLLYIFWKVYVTWPCLLLCPEPKYEILLQPIFKIWGKITEPWSMFCTRTLCPQTILAPRHLGPKSPRQKQKLMSLPRKARSESTTCLLVITRNQIVIECTRKQLVIRTNLLAIVRSVGL